MTTLQAVGFTLLAGAGVTSVSVVCFGRAIRGQNPLVAPRATARSPNVIYNPDPKSVQNRGSPSLGWIRWSLSLSYEDMLKGIPGTGTREGGMDGTLLATNLDGVVLIRFHALCFRVASLAAILYIIVILPLNLTANCGGDATEVCVKQGNLTNFDRTTLANIPSLGEIPVEELEDNGPITTFETVFGDQYRDILGRCYGIVLVTWITCFYCTRLLWREWQQLLALRRVFYLEFDHFEEREEELASVLEAPVDVEADCPELDPWIPHPELRETVPNVALYSVLVRGIPSIPTQLFGDLEITHTGGLDWQLSATAAYFDSCVPNQPGFSSSVAAVTILPDPNKSALAWRKWYAAAAKVRRLRYIRSLIREKTQADPPERTKERLENMSSSPSPKFDIYRNLSTRKYFFGEAFGSSNEDDFDNYVEQYGIEQAAAYSRDFAQSGSLCCPNGFLEGRLRKKSLAELKILEEEALDDVQEAQEELAEVKKSAFQKDPITTEEFLVAAAAATPISSGRRKSAVFEEKEDSSFSDEGSWEDKIQDAFLRRRVLSGKWSEAETIVSRNSTIRAGIPKRGKLAEKIDDGKWISQKSLQKMKQTMTSTSKLVAEKSQAYLFDGLEKGIKEMTRLSTFACVTFTSRQAAVAARQCLTTGTGGDGWIALRDIPVPPLADAAPWYFSGRNICRPVTMTINEHSKRIRHAITMIVLIIMFFLYTIPLTAVQNLLAPSDLDSILPFLNKMRNSAAFINVFSGILSGLVYTLFFSLCPIMFKTLANYGSNALSVRGAEYSALQYYWCFMVFAAFSGTSLASILLNGLGRGVRVGEEASNVLREIAGTIPTQVSAAWLSWIIVRFSFTLPVSYMLQLQAIVFKLMGWNCCARVSHGGGPGGPVPFRVYVDSGVVFMCLIALGPASPLVGLAAWIYFLFFIPILRRNLIFVYRPHFDGGGLRWPFLFDVLISAMLVGYFLLAVMMFLKRAAGPGFFAGLPIIPTVYFRQYARSRFLRSYEDTALHQSSKLDGWDIDEPSSMQLREEFRRFLVDSHKAAYVPVCLAGSEDVITAEPAVVIPREGETATFDQQMRIATDLDAGPRSGRSPRKKQIGASMRRVSAVHNLDSSAFEEVAKLDIANDIMVEEGSDSSLFNDTDRAADDPLLNETSSHEASRDDQSSSEEPRAQESGGHIHED